MKQFKIQVEGVAYDIFCGNYFTYNSPDPVYPLTKLFGLGTGIGGVRVNLNNVVAHAPVKIVCSIEGVVVLNTGYWGNTTNHQASLNDVLTANGYPTEIMNDDMGVPQDFYFNKSSNSAQVLKVECFAPLGVQYDAPNWFSVTVYCPNPNIVV